MLGLLASPGLAFAAAYKTHFDARFEPSEAVVHASIAISQDTQQVRIIDLAAPSSRYSDFEGDGEIVRHKGRLQWTVPHEGGTLRYRVKVDHHKGESYDARMTDSWALLRLDSLFPPARVMAQKDARSRSSFVLRGPEGWAFESRYGPAIQSIEFSTPGRRFSRPTGWVAAGELGIRRELIKDRMVVLAGPEDQGMRRLDILAFMNWTFPKLLKVFPKFPERLLIVGASDDMWRGGLSGPSSLFLHNDRPLISENATSTLIHELVHVATGLAAKKDDWLVEGVAEYYSLEILRRSGGISQKRYDEAMQRLQRWVKRDRGKLKSPSKGVNTAYAVLLLGELNQELRQNDAGSIDWVISQLVDSGDFTGAHMLELIESSLDGKPSLLRAQLPDHD